MIKPAFHHVNLKTTRLQEMIDWYGVVVGTTVNSQSNNIAFISNDRTHHRIALLAIPGLRDDPEKFVHTGLNPRNMFGLRAGRRNISDRVRTGWNRRWRTPAPGSALL